MYKRQVIANRYSGDRVYTLKENPEMITRILNAAWNKMYRRSLFEDNGITYPFGYLYEDLGTTYKLLLKARSIAFVNEPLYDYLADRPGNITQSFKDVYKRQTMIRVKMPVSVRVDIMLKMILI